MSTPMDGHVKLLLYEGKTISLFSYSKMIGSLMYSMTSIRPDITYTVRKLTRYTSDPGPSHWIAIRRILKCLKVTMSQGLGYSGELLVLEGYSDASRITKKDVSSSTSRWVFMYGGGAISWSSKKQNVYRILL